MKSRRRLCSALLLILALSPSACGLFGGGGPPEPAPSAPTMSVEQVERLLTAGVPHDQILSTAREACIGFRVDEEVETRLTRAGADSAFLTALQDVCYRES